MSHFSVLVAIPAGTDLADLDSEIERRMAPFDENREVTPYKDYVEGGPEDYWWVESVRRGAASLAAGEKPEVRPGIGDRDGMVWSNYARRHITTAEREQEIIDGWRDNAIWAEKLGEHPDWETVVRLYREKYHPGTEIALAGDVSWGDMPEGLLFDAEEGKAFEWSTYPPNAKWDYWRIGGRWAGGYFMVKKDGPGLITAPLGWDSPKEPKPGLRADGGPKKLLDLDGMRENAWAEASARYNRFLPVAEAHPGGKAWSKFAEEVEAGLISIDDARKTYQAQPVVQAWRKIDGDRFFGECPLDEFGVSREEYCDAAAASAVPGYAFLSLEGEWIAPGRMGWFGMSSDGKGDREGYNAAVNLYINEQLGDDDYLVVLDCHI